MGRGREWGLAPGGERAQQRTYRRPARPGRSGVDHRPQDPPPLGSVPKHKNRLGDNHSLILGESRSLPRIGSRGPTPTSAEAVGVAFHVVLEGLGDTGVDSLPPVPQMEVTWIPHPA